MLKKLLLAASLIALAFSANAQVATPQLDTAFPTYGGAAAGWRFNSSVSIVGLVADNGKGYFEGEKAGDVIAGFNANGPDDSGNIPYLSAALRGETWGADLYSNLSNGLNTDVDLDITGIHAYFDKFEYYSEEKEQKLNLAYVLGETLSIGIGYSSTKTKSQNIITANNIDFSLLNPVLPSGVIFGLFKMDITNEITTTEMGVTASFRLAEIFFIAGGIQQVSQTGTKENVTTQSPSGATTVTTNTYDYVENSWNNTLMGFGVLLGDPDDMQFRAEYSSITSPESKKEANGSKIASNHHATTHTFATVEVKWSDILIAYQLETEKEAELNDESSESTTTLVGLGYQPLEGLAISLYSFNKSAKLERDINGTVNEVELKPAGYRIHIGYNF